MKKISYLLLIMLSISSCETIKFSKLPDIAQTFVNTHFPGIEVLESTKDKDDGVRTYDVSLRDGTDILFSKDGDWLIVDIGSFTTMPEGILALLPTEITTYVIDNYSDASIIEIDKENPFGYEIELNTPNVSLFFDTEGKFIRLEGEAYISN